MEHIEKQHCKISKITHLDIAIDIISDLNASEWYCERLEQILGKTTADCDRVILVLSDNYQYEYNCIESLESELISIKDMCYSCKDKVCEKCDLYHYDVCYFENCDEFFCDDCECDNCTKLKEKILNLSKDLSKEEILSSLRMDYCDHVFDFEIGQLEEKENIDEVRNIIKDKWIPYVKSLSV